jgi:hypothetical protein
MNIAELKNDTVYVFDSNDNKHLLLRPMQRIFMMLSPEI